MDFRGGLDEILKNKNVRAVFIQLSERAFFGSTVTFATVSCLMDPNNVCAFNSSGILQSTGCESYKITVEANTAFIRILCDALRDNQTIWQLILILDCRYIDANDMIIQISEALKHNNTLLSLALSEISSKAAMALGHLLRTNKTLDRFTISHQNTGLDMDSWKCIADALCDNQTLHHFCIRGMESSKATRPLVEMLCFNHHIISMGEEFYHSILPVMNRYPDDFRVLSTLVLCLRDTDYTDYVFNEIIEAYFMFEKIDRLQRGGYYFYNTT